MNEKDEIIYFTAKEKRFVKYIDRNKIEEVVISLAERINNDYHGKQVLFIAVLKGSIFFAADLLRKMKMSCELETVRASSYGNEMKNSELILNTENININNKDVIIIEDIIDRGNTLAELMNKLKAHSPKSLEAVAFLSKPDSIKEDVNVKYQGIQIPSKFVIGYGLDYAEQGRHLPDIYILEDK